MKGGIVALNISNSKGKKYGLFIKQVSIFMGTVDEETGADSELDAKWL